MFFIVLYYLFYGLQRGCMDNSDIAKMEFECAMEELERIVAKLESGEVTLKDSIRMYERGVSLKKHCEELLNQARLIVQKVNTDNNATLGGSE